MSTAETVLELVRSRRMVRPRDLEEAGISPTHLQRLYEQGLIERSSRGVYLPLDAPLEAHQTLAEVALRVPSGIVCLLSALQFHQFTTQSPHEVWLALPPRTHRPRLDSVSLRLFQMSGPLLTEGIETHEIGSVVVRITNPARTVADCFKFRNKVGLDIALEALTDGWRRRKFTMDALWAYGKLCHVSNVMRPYLETLSL